MTKDELQTLRGLCERAVSGPWHTQPDGAGMTEVYSDKLQRDGLDIGVAGDLREHDAAFIAAARSALPALIDEAERLTKILDDRMCMKCGGQGEWCVDRCYGNEHYQEMEQCAECNGDGRTEEGAQKKIAALTADRGRLAAECERLRALVNRAADSLDYCVQRHGEYNKSVRGDELRAAAKEGLT